MGNETQTAAKNLTAKKLRTGEIAVWDDEVRTLTLVSAVSEHGEVTARIIKGATLKALEEALGDVVVLI